MTVITVSRQLGSMGSYIALEVADRLGFRFLDREILDTVARQAGVPSGIVEDIEDRVARLSRVMRILGARPKLPVVASASEREQEAFDERVGALMARGGMTRNAALSRLESAGGTEYAGAVDYLDLVTSVVVEYAAQGKAVIVGRGGQMILRGRPDVLHVQVISKFESRVFNLMQRDAIKWREAAHRIRRADELRAGYLRRFYNVDWLDSSLYDVVINTDRLSSSVATDMILQAEASILEGVQA